MGLSNSDKGIEVVNGELVKVTPAGLEFLKTNPSEFWESITSIGECAFKFSTILESIVIPEGITSIGKYAFLDCTSIKSVVLKEGVTSLGVCAFNGCRALSSIKMPKSLTEIGEGAFLDCKSLQNINIPDSVTSIGVRAFDGCTSLTKITIPKGVTTISDNAFNLCVSLTNIEIPEGVISIGERAFDYNRTLKDIKLPNGLKSIGANAFSNCSLLKRMEIPKGVVSIGARAFMDCTSLKSVIIPEGVTRIGESVFVGCISLQSIKLPSSLTRIEFGMFSECQSLKRIRIPEGVMDIGNASFKMCKALSNVKIPETVTSIEKEAFSYCMSLKKIVIPESVTNIEMSVFADCKSLTSIKMPKNLTSIADGMFWNCKSLKNIEMPEKAISIGTSAFNCCISLKTLELPETVTNIGGRAFAGCSLLKSITIPDSVTNIGDGAFDGCNKLTSVRIPANAKNIGNGYENQFKYAYLSKDGKDIVFSKEKDKNLIDGLYEFKYDEFGKIGNLNYRKNYVNLRNLKEDGKVKFIPPDYALETFPYTEMDSFFVNKNYQRWRELVKELGFDTLGGVEKNNYLTDLMKTYYAIGGFSNNKGESEKAYEYVLNYVAVSKKENSTPKDIGEELHTRFSRLTLNGVYNKTFAQFFMKNYKDNPDFMNLELKNVIGKKEKQDYLCAVHNSFERILKQYPNRTINGNEERSLLTPLFLAQHCSVIQYDNIDEGNNEMAFLIGQYGYNQNQFEHIQNAYNTAKCIKDKYVIVADKANEEDCITYRVLEKDDPLGFVLGDITNCCQVIGGAGATCVDDGYTNPNAGFMVFEENIKNESGKNTGKTRVLGQAYVWYDAVTKTVCYDNIEIPTKIINELRSGDKANKNISSEKLIEAVEKSAMSVMAAMNKKGIEVKRVTTGEGYNDLNKELSRKFEKEINPKARNRNSCVYSDARNAQYIIATYEQTTNNCAKEMRELMSDAEKMINEMKNENIKQKPVGRSL